MKRTILPLATLAFLMASCEISSENKQTGTYYGYNLIIDKDNPDQKALASFGTYGFTFDIARGTISIQGTDIIINNQKQSFETDTMAYRVNYYKTTLNDQDVMIGQTLFSKSGPSGIGSMASDIKGTITGMYTPSTNDTLSNDFIISLTERLDMSYTLSNRYQIKTFWPNSLYLGQTFASDSEESFNSRTPRYMAKIDFSKNKATVFIYNLKLSSSDDSLPKVIRIGDIPVNFDHDSYYLEAEAPKTTVLSKRNNTAVLIDSVGFQVENFTLRITSDDLTDANISYRLKGKSINFAGSCVPKP